MLLTSSQIRNYLQFDIQQLSMFDFFDSLCGCFTPQVKRSIIEYLSSATLNRSLIEQQKISEGVSAPEESIYSQVKAKSFYFMKLQEDQQKQERQSPQDQISKSIEEPNYYPLEGYEGASEIYKTKLALLKKILREEVGSEYSKVYDSQDETALKIYCKPQIYKNKRFNAYRFTFRIPQKQLNISPKDYLQIDLEGQQFNIHEPLLVSRQKVAVTEQGMQIFHRKYKKVLVINQHQFYTAEKSELIDQEGKEAAYTTIFSVKGEWNKLHDCSRGWLNLSGLRVALQKQQLSQTSLKQEEQYLQIDGYINCQLQMSVNANMLKQPIAKQIRTYVPKLICSLTRSDAI